MRLSTSMAALATASIAIAPFCLWSFYQSLDPIPSELRPFTGIATDVHTSTVLYSRSHATFQLNQANGDTIEFAYLPKFKRFYFFAEHIRDGAKIEVMTGPGGKKDIWGIKLDSKILMTPLEAREARMTNGKWVLALSFGLIAFGIWSAREASRLRHRDA